MKKLLLIFLIVTILNIKNSHSDSNVNQCVDGECFDKTESQECDFKYKTCAGPPDCKSLGDRFTCDLESIKSGCTPSKCTMDADCNPKSCSSDCLHLTGYCRIRENSKSAKALEAIQTFLYYFSKGQLKEMVGTLTSDAVYVFDAHPIAPSGNCAGVYKGTEQILGVLQKYGGLYTPTGADLREIISTPDGRYGTSTGTFSSILNPEKIPSKHNFIHFYYLDHNYKIYRVEDFHVQRSPADHFI